MHVDSNFFFEFQSSLLVIMRVRLSRRLSPLAVFSRFCGLLHLALFIYRLIFSRLHFAKPSRSILINFYLWSNVCIEAVDRNEEGIIFVFRCSSMHNRYKSTRASMTSHCLHLSTRCMGVQPLVDLRRAGCSAACSVQTGGVDDSRDACFHAAKQVWEMKGGHWQCKH